LTRFDLPEPELPERIESARLIVTPGDWYFTVHVVNDANAREATYVLDYACKRVVGIFTKERGIEWNSPPPPPSHLPPRQLKSEPGGLSPQNQSLTTNG
jgi:hypothetical protein